MKTFEDWLACCNLPAVVEYASVLEPLGLSRATFRRPVRDVVADLIEAGIPKIQAADITHSATEYFEDQARRESMPLGIFWDVENVSIPQNVSGDTACRAIKSKLSKFGPVKLFNAYMSVGREKEGGQETVSTAKRSALQLSGCHIIDTPHMNRKEVADKMIIVDALLFAMEQKATKGGATLCFITGDTDFAYLLSQLSDYPQFSTVLVSNRAVQTHHFSSGRHNILHESAQSVLDWCRDILGLQPQSSTKERQKPQVERKEGRHQAASSSAHHRHNGAPSLGATSADVSEASDSDSEDEEDSSAKGGEVATTSRPATSNEPKQFTAIRAAVEELCKSNDDGLASKQRLGEFLIQAEPEFFADKNARNYWLDKALHAETGFLTNTTLTADTPMIRFRLRKSQILYEADADLDLLRVVFHDLDQKNGKRPHDKKQVLMALKSKNPIAFGEHKVRDEVLRRATHAETGFLVEELQDTQGATARPLTQLRYRKNQGRYLAAPKKLRGDRAGGKKVGAAPANPTTEAEGEFPTSRTKRLRDD